MILWYLAFFYPRTPRTISSVKANIFLSIKKTFSFHFYYMKVSGNSLNIHINTFKIKVLKVTQLMIRKIVWKAIILKIFNRFVNYAPVFSLSKFFRTVYIIFMEFWDELYFEKKYSFHLLE